MGGKGRGAERRGGEGREERRGGERVGCSLLVVASLLLVLHIKHTGTIKLTCSLFCHESAHNQFLSTHGGTFSKRESHLSSGCVSIVS